MALRLKIDKIPAFGGLEAFPAILPAQVGPKKGRAPYDRRMRPLIAMSLVLIVFGLALGLLNLYIVGRIDGSLLLIFIAVMAFIAASLVKK